VTPMHCMMTAMRSVTHAEPTLKDKELL